jgi:hypothetical protein
LDSIAVRRDLAGRSIERRVSGIARARKIQLPPPLPNVRYPSAEHRAADSDERILDILTRVLKSLDPNAAELKDEPRGVINEYRESTEMGTTQSHSGEEPRKGDGTFKEVSYGEGGGAESKVRKAPDIEAPEPMEGLPTEGDEGADDGETFGDENLTLDQLEGVSDDDLAQKPGIGEATIKKIHKARAKAARRKAK